MLNQVISKLNTVLFSGVQKQVVGIALTPGLGLEAVVYDRSKHVVLNYGRKKVEYNFSTREIQDYMQFKTALSELIQQMEIAPKSIAYMSLPNIYFDFMEVPTTIADEEVKTAILSKAEEFYLFKKEEPVSGWCEVVNPNRSGPDVDQKRIAYASIQRSVVEELKEIFADVGLHLVGIENAYSTTIRGLYITGLLDDCILERAAWAAMIINTNSYTLFYFDTKDLLDCTEVPIAIKSFSPEEAYGAIASSASQLLTNFQASKLFIISQTDDLGAEVLKGQMQFDREIVTIDASKYSKKPILDVVQATDFALANSMSLGALGASHIKCDFGLVMNLMADDPEANLGVYFTKEIAGVTIDVTSDLVMRLCIAVSIVIVAICLLLWSILKLADNQAQRIASELGSEIQKIQRTINQEGKVEVKNNEVDMNQVIDEVAKMNVEAVKYYEALATDIPKDIWLTRYYNKDGDRIVIQGLADNIVDIYEYFKNLKIASPQSDIRLNELKVVADTPENQELYKGIVVSKDGSRLYSFEISNTALGYGSIMEQVNQNNPNPDGGGNGSQMTNDTDIIINGAPVEQLSSQVKPAQ
ncbi:PilN domain-containing protein [bacterium]|nr:PilN domain-containing protein [bacterium]